jgi:predicted nucleic acid-binding protein
MILVDTSVWIEYFKGTPRSAVLNELIDNNTLCINDLILSELLPSINHHKEYALREMLLSVAKTEMNINWNQIISMQTQNLLHGINKVGIPDLFIVQNAIDNNIQLFSYDKHFKLMSDLFGLRLFEWESLTKSST